MIKQRFGCETIHDSFPNAKLFGMDVIPNEYAHIIKYL